MASTQEEDELSAAHMCAQRSLSVVYGILSLPLFLWCQLKNILGSLIIGSFIESLIGNYKAVNYSAILEALS